MATFLSKGRELIYNSPVAHHSGIILSKLCEQYSEGRNCDLEIRLNERKIFAHKCLIEVFFTNAGAELEKDMFYLDMRQYNTDAVLPLIDMIYSGELRAVPGKVNQVLKVAQDVGFHEAIAGSRLYLRLHNIVFSDSNVPENVSVKEEPVDMPDQNLSIASFFPELNLPPQLHANSDKIMGLENKEPPKNVIMGFEDKEPSKNVYQVLRVDQNYKSKLLKGGEDMTEFLAESANGSEHNLTVLESSIGKKNKRVELKNQIDATAIAGSVKTVLVAPPKMYQGKLLKTKKPRNKRVTSNVTPSFVENDDDDDASSGVSEEGIEPVVKMEFPAPGNKRKLKETAAETERSAAEDGRRKGKRSLRNKQRVNYNVNEIPDTAELNTAVVKPKKVKAKLNKKQKGKKDAQASTSSLSSKGTSSYNIQEGTGMRKKHTVSQVGTSPEHRRNSSDGYKFVPATASVPDGCKSSYAQPVRVRTKFVTETYSNNLGNVQVVTREVPIRTPTFRKFLPDKSKEPQVIVVCHPTKPIVKI